MKYRKRPVIVEAIQFTEETKYQVFNFITCTTYPEFNDDGSPCIKIRTLEGTMIASLGDFVIKGVNGEFYPCKPDIFEKTYELVEVA